jgi:cell filamentation protein
LEAFEVEMSTLRAEEPLPIGRFGPAHYRQVHHHLFQDVYRWAGRYRTVRTSKDGNPFCYPEFIPTQMERLFRRLTQLPLIPGAARQGFIVAVADFLAELNAVHPFREGNGRSQLAFLHLVAIRAGHPLRLERIRRETFMPAMVASFHGALEPLIAELSALNA